MRTNTNERIVARWLLATFVAAGAAGCSGSSLEPASLDTRNDQCRNCRMAVSDRHFAAQIVAPGEEPLFFDDIGCLREFAAERSNLAAGAVAFVADHRTAEWVDAARALYTENHAVSTPMNSGLMAHRDSQSRNQDPAARGGQPVSAGDILGMLAVAPER